MSDQEHRDPAKEEQDARTDAGKIQEKQEKAILGDVETDERSRAIQALDSLSERLRRTLEEALRTTEELQLAMKLLPNTAELKKYRADLQKRLGVLKGTALDISNKLELK